LTPHDVLRRYHAIIDRIAFDLDLTRRKQEQLEQESDVIYAYLQTEFKNPALE